MFLGLPDPDPLVRGTNPDPDPSIFQQNSKKNMDSFCSVTLWSSGVMLQELTVPRKLFSPAPFKKYQYISYFKKTFTHLG
jgi:hypothetical protein